MEFRYSLTLPRDALTVPIARRLSQGAMLELGVVPQDISDVAVAISEACANVIEHSSDTDDEYDVIVTVSERRCEIKVIDTGRGFDAAAVPPGADSDEHGRGLRLMRALVDTARFDSTPLAGTVVHLEKALQLEEGSPFHRLSQRAPSPRGPATHRAATASERPA